MIILIYTEKALEKVQPFFVIKVLKKLGLEKAFYLNKDFIQQGYSQYYTKWRNIVIISSKTGTRVASSLLFNTELEVLARTIRQEKYVKMIK